MYGESEIIAFMFGSMRKRIPYDKYIATLTGSVTSSLLLQQMIYWWSKQGMKPFFKFNKPCDNRFYRKGDSWTEELGFNITKFRNARDKICTKVKTSNEIESLLERDETNTCFISYTDKDNLTWFHINLKAVMKLIKDSIALEIEEKGLSEKPDVAVEYFSNVNQAEEPKTVVVKPSKKLKFDKDAKIMPKGFTLDQDVIDTAINLGYNSEDVGYESVKFVRYYTEGKGRSRRERDWGYQFIYGWLDRNYKNGYTKRNGVFYTISANEERRNAIERLVTTDIFADIPD